jgi:uncharacterized protein YggE
MATITVRGSGVVAATPDDVTVGLTLEALRPTPAEAFHEASERAAAAVSLLDELGVPEGSRLTSAVSLLEHGEHVDGQWQHRGYRASTRVAARLADGGLASRVLSEAVARLEARVDGPSWRVAPYNPAHGEARRLAALDARAKAEAYVEALGARLGAIATIAEPGAQAEPPVALQALRLSAAGTEMPVAAGDLLVSAAVDVTFQVEQG